jgi:hypothetical protein
VQQSHRERDVLSILGVLGVNNNIFPEQYGKDQRKKRREKIWIPDNDYMGVVLMKQAQEGEKARDVKAGIKKWVFVTEKKCIQQSGQNGNSHYFRFKYAVVFALASCGNKKTHLVSLREKYFDNEVLVCVIARGNKQKSHF